jgi:hypothetical protein
MVRPRKSAPFDALIRQLADAVMQRLGTLMRTALALCAALISAAPASAATLRGPADVTTLTSAADAVVHGKVVRAESDWAGGDPHSGQIFTRVTLRPLSWWKGRGPAEIIVLVAGGTVDAIGQLVPGSARFEPGEDVVVFLRRRGPKSRSGKESPVFDVERWALGKFSVAGGGTDARATRERVGVTCVDCGAREEDVLPLAELRDRVSAAQRRDRK